MVSLVAELRGHERQAAEELEQWKTRVKEPKPLDASRAAIRLALLLTDEEGGDAEDGHGELPGHEFTDCGTPAELSAATIALEISSRNSASRHRKNAGTGCAPASN